MNKKIIVFHSEFKKWYKRSSFLIIALVLMFLLIGLLTSIQPAYRLSSASLHQWTGEIEGSSFLYVMGMENRLFKDAYPDDHPDLDVSEMAFQMATSIKPEDPRSLLGRELPGFSVFDGEILIAGEGSDYTNMPIESSPPMNVFDNEEEAVITETTPPEPPMEEEPVLTTGDRDVVFIYHTHNRESFLPMLPPGTHRDLAYHSKANITLVGQRLAQALENNGIGTKVDLTDFTGQLSERGMQFHESYDLSRPVLKDAISKNRDLQFFFDLHRDSYGRKITTTTINGKSYARIYFVIGGEFARYEQNEKLATTLHKKIEEKYPGLSRGVTTKSGPKTNGKFNQDLSQNAMIIEFGGVENNLEELYRTADAVADVFSDFYWQAEKVNGN